MRLINTLPSDYQLTIPPKWPASVAHRALCCSDSRNSLPTLSACVFL